MYNHSCEGKIQANSVLSRSSNTDQWRTAAGLSFEILLVSVMKCCNFNFFFIHKCTLVMRRYKVFSLPNQFQKKVAILMNDIVFESLIKIKVRINFILISNNRYVVCVIISE